jgi:hypothetical protein
LAERALRHSDLIFHFFTEYNASSRVPSCMLARCDAATNSIGEQPPFVNAGKRNEGVKPGDQVVLNPMMNLVEGSKVVVRNKMLSS